MAAATSERLNAVLTVGSLVSNPIDGGFGVLSSTENFMTSVDALDTDPNVDLVLIQEGLPRAPGSDRTERYIRLAEDYAATRATKPIAFVTPISHGQTDYSREVRAAAPHVSFLQEAYKALRAIASVARRDERERLALDAISTAQPPGRLQRDLVERLAATATAEPAALDEARSKELLRAYGIATPAEALVDFARRRDRGCRAHRLSRRAQGGVDHDHPQVGHGGGGPRSGDTRRFDRRL